MSFPFKVDLDPEWLISYLIPKKTEKFEYRKIFVTIFFNVKKLTQITKFWYFLATQFSKNCEIFSFRHWKFFRNSIFSDFWGIKSAISHFTNLALRDGFLVRNTSGSVSTSSLSSIWKLNFSYSTSGHFKSLPVKWQITFLVASLESSFPFCLK